MPLPISAFASHGAAAWAADMLASYRTLNPEQATWFDGAGSAVETELLARLQPGGYLHTTFGPDGQDKSACDFVFVLKTVGDITSRTITKSGDALRWDIDGTVTTQDDVPAHTLGAGAGVLTCSSTDGWSGVTIFYGSTNQFSGAPPLWNFPAVTTFYAQNNQFSGVVPLWDLPAATDFRIQNNQFSSISAPLPNLHAVSNLQLQDNGLLQPAVDAALLAIYTARADYTDATPELQIQGSNAAPSGTYQYSATPSTGLEYIYALANDDDAEGFSKWVITYTDQAAAEWATDMLASYRTLNPEQATWFDAAGSAVETELLARLQPGGYLHTTFGPSGQNKAACDFVFVLKTVGNIVTRLVSKGGATLRWDIDGTVYNQTNNPNHTLGAGAGVLTCSSTDGWTGILTFRIEINSFSGPAPLWVFPAVTDFRIRLNQFSNTVPLWNFPVVTNFQLHQNQFSDITAPLPNLIKVSELLAYDNGLSQSEVDAALLAIYNARANYTDATPELRIEGSNAAPSGTYQYSATPSTGLEYIYALANDPDGELFNKWIITYTDQAAAEWATDMLASYRTLNPEQATWFDGAGAAVETELLARLQPGGYLHTTFGPSGQNKLACDFVFVLKTVGNMTARNVIKTGATLRWDVDGTVYSQNTNPAHTLGAGAGILTCSTTDGWSGVTTFNIISNAFTCAAPKWVFTAVKWFYIYDNQFSGTAPPWVFPSCTDLYIFSNQFSSLSALLPNLLKISDLRAYTNGLSQAEVDAALAAIYNNWAGYTDATPELQIHGTNATPSGTYADEDPPTTGLGYVYELANDPESTGNETWTITYTGGVAP